MTFRCYFIFAVFLGFYARDKVVFKFTNIHCPAVFQHLKKQGFQPSRTYRQCGFIIHSGKTCIKVRTSVSSTVWAFGYSLRGCASWSSTRGPKRLKKRCPKTNYRAKGSRTYCCSVFYSSKFKLAILNLLFMYILSASFSKIRKI